MRSVTPAEGMELSDDELEASLGLSCGLLSVQMDKDAYARVVSDNGGVFVCNKGVISISELKDSG